MKTDTANKQDEATKASAVKDFLTRLVITYRRNRNKARWWRQEFARRRCWRGFQGWMIRRHGDFEYGCGARSWRVNGTLISLWVQANRLIIYRYNDDGKCRADGFELADRHDNNRARAAIKLLSNNDQTEV